MPGGRIPFLSSAIGGEHYAGQYLLHGFAIKFLSKIKFF